MGLKYPQWQRRALRTAGYGGFICIALLAMYKEPAPNNPPPVQFDDGTRVTYMAEWSRAVYPDGSECMWRNSDVRPENSMRCIDKHGQPIKLAPLAPVGR